MMIRASLVVLALAFAGCASTTKVSESAAKYLTFENGKFQLKDKVYFETGSATLDPKSNDLLNAFALVMMENRSLRISVDGHTDNEGGAEANLKLSQARAESVVAYIVTRGIVADRLTAKGFGDTQPIGPNETEEGRSVNRRVEFTAIQ